MYLTIIVPEAWYLCKAAKVRQARAAKEDVTL
jgi:hypothetical protein